MSDVVGLSLFVVAVFVIWALLTAPTGFDVHDHPKEDDQ